MLGATETTAVAVNGGRAMWVAPSYKQANEGWNLIRFLAPQFGGRIREADRACIFPSGGQVESRTSDNPHALRGSGLDFVVLDECRDMDPITWTEVLRWNLADRAGRALFISTPNGRDWFHDLYQRGLDPDQHDWESFTYTTFDNPALPDTEKVQIREEYERGNIPEAVYRQEVLGEFVESEGAVFRNLRAASTGRRSAPVQGARYVGFADLADVHDSNAVAVFRVDGDHRDHPAQVHADRWTRVEVETTIRRLEQVRREYPGEWAVDATGLGRLFSRQNLPTWQHVTFTNDVKRDMVHTLQAKLESNSLTLLSPEDSDAARVQYNELMDFQSTRLPSGLTRYEAPPGKHDDMAIAVMGAIYTAQRTGGNASATLLSLGVFG